MNLQSSQNKKALDTKKHKVRIQTTQIVYDELIYGYLIYIITQYIELIFMLMKHSGFEVATTAVSG